MTTHTAPTNSAPTHTGEQHVTYELAIYRVHDGDAFAARHHELHDTVGRLPGVLSAVALRGQEQSDVFADVVLWSSHADAVSAAEHFATSPVAEWFGTQCAEMLFFGHLAANPLVPAAPGGAPLPAPQGATEARPA